MQVNPETVLMLKTLLGLRLAIGRRLRSSRRSPTEETASQTIYNLAGRRPSHPHIRPNQNPHLGHGTPLGAPFTSHWTEHSSKYVL